MIEHLRAGTIEKTTGRTHHPDEIEGYTGNRRRVGHGQAYPSSKTGLVEYHGLTDGLTDQSHEKAIDSAKRKLGGLPSARFQKMSEEYKRPPTGY